MGFFRSTFNMFGDVLFNTESNDGRIREGQTSYGKVLWHIDGDFIREGDGPYGKIVAKVCSDGRIREGQTSYGKVIAHIDGEFIREGDGPYGKVLMNVRDL